MALPSLPIHLTLQPLFYQMPADKEDKDRDGSSGKGEEQERPGHIHTCATPAVALTDMQG